MKRQSVFCDRCGNIILEPECLTSLAVEAGPLRDQRRTVDLCLECCHLLTGWLAEVSEEPPRPMAARA